MNDSMQERVIRTLETGLPVANGRPKIAIVPAAFRLVGDYADAIYEAGGEPIVIPRGSQGLAILSQCDGLMLTGVGATDNDVPQAFWTDEPRDSHRWETMEELNTLAWCEWLMGVCIWARRRGIPTLGAGLGAQMLVVAAGGKLLRHIDGHESSDLYRPGGTQKRIEFMQGSWLTAAWAMATADEPTDDFPTGADVICSHHQAPDPESLPDEVKVVAWTNDEVPDPDNEELRINLQVPHAWELIGQGGLPWGFGLQFEPQHSEDPAAWGNMLLHWFVSQLQQ